MPPMDLSKHLPCNTLQHTQHTATHTAIHCNTLQHTATHCNTLQHTATHIQTSAKCRYLTGRNLSSATHCNTLYNTLQQTATHCTTHPDFGKMPPFDLSKLSMPPDFGNRIPCNTLQHPLQHAATPSATHCNTLCNTAVKALHAS